MLASKRDVAGGGGLRDHHAMIGDGRRRDNTMGRERKVIGHILSIQWGTPYTEPPDGQPRVIAEYFVLHADYCGKTPPEITNFPGYKIGCGWSQCHTCLMELPTEWSNERKAINRQQCLRRRLEKKIPMFADNVFAEVLKSKPAYYLAGVSVGDAKRKEILDEQARQIEFWRAHVGELIIHGTIPDTPVILPEAWFPWRDKQESVEPGEVPMWTEMFR